jgi:hypothetical protein
VSVFPGEGSERSCICIRVSVFPGQGSERSCICIRVSVFPGQGSERSCICIKVSGFPQFLQFLGTLSTMWYFLFSFHYIVIRISLLRV